MVGTLHPLVLRLFTKRGLAEMDSIALKGEVVLDEAFTLER
jgi:hypothetical protein